MSNELFASLLEKVSSQAMNGCGCSHDMYLTRLRQEADYEASRLPSDQRKAFIAYCTGHGDYCEPGDERTEGFCCHGFPDGCCPIGCDDIETSDDDFDGSIFSIDPEVAAELAEEQAQLEAEDRARQQAYEDEQHALLLAREEAIRAEEERVAHILNLRRSGRKLTLKERAIAYPAKPNYTLPAHSH